MNTIDRIKAREKERAYLLAQLDLWAKVKAQGIEPDTVRSFGFDTRLLTQEQKRQWHRPHRVGELDPYIETLRTGKTRPKVFNYVRHHDGSQTVLDPVLEAVYE